MTPFARPFMVLGSLMMGFGAACSGADSGSEPTPPPLDPFAATGKADASDLVRSKGPLSFDAALTGAFAEDLEFHGMELAVRPASVVNLEVTQKGSSRQLDTTLYVYGPRTATGAFGTKALAFDDDAGYGKLSKLSALTLAEGGTYLVVVGTHDGRGRGNYRLQATCASGACGPVAPQPSGACHAAIRGAIDACVDGWLADPDYDASQEVRSELIGRCADPEVTAAAFDALCADASAPAELCALDMEAFAVSYLPGCGQAAVNDWLDTACVFGSRYGDLFGAAEALVVVETVTLTADDSLTVLDGQQIVAAVRTTAYADVQTLAEALDAVDQGEVHRTTLWDASNRKAYSAFEVGAGDNSFGLIFDYGTVNVAARINDGDLYDCTAVWGPERRRCTSNAQCVDATQCIGASESSPLGRCTAPSRDDHPALGASCDGDATCPIEGGLVCHGASLSGAGLCGPAWMRGRFDNAPAAAIPDNKGAGVTATVLVFGLGTVSTDVRLHLLVSHARSSDLTVTLRNPAGTDVVALQGAPAASNGELLVEGLPLGYPGDESANGVWTLTVVDGKSGKAGTLQSFGLELGSRWD